MNSVFETVRQKIKQNITREKILKRRTIGPVWAMLSIVLITLIGFHIQSLIQNGFASNMHFIYYRYHHVVLLNTLPVLLTALLSYFITQKMWAVCIISYLPLIVLNLVNYYKVLFRDEPLKMSDFQLMSEMENITQNYQLTITKGMVVAVIAAIIVTLIFALFKTGKNKLPVRITGLALTVCAVIVSLNFVYTRNIYDNIKTEAMEYHDSSITTHKGLLYSFIVSSDSLSYKAPKGYNEQDTQTTLAQYAPAAEDEQKINVIAVMGEAFFDVNRGATVEYENNINPYENYQRIKSEGYSGKLVVPGFGGATEATEFEFLTGTNLYTLNKSMPTAYKTYIIKPTYSIAQYFKNLGYDTLALHPGYGWFYNRNSAYINLGFDNFISREEMGENLPMIYGYIEDSFLTQNIIDNYLKHYEQTPEKPYFNFTITIQNHGPYPDYDEGRETIYKRPDDISDENYYIINNYLSGVKATDKLLGDICNFAAGRLEPIAVLFFGDHLPFLDGDNECYDIIGYGVSGTGEAELENRHKVEYVMWCNDAAKQEITGKGRQVKTGEGPEISSNFLGVELLDYIGAEMPPYFAYIHNLEQSINVISQYYFKEGNNKFFQPSQENEELLNQYRYIEYYNLRSYDGRE